MISLDLDARQRLVLGHEFVVPARIGPHEQGAPIVVTDFAEIPLGRPLERIFVPPGHEKNGDRLTVLALQLLRKVEKLECRPNRGRCALSSQSRCPPADCALRSQEPLGT